MSDNKEILGIRIIEINTIKFSYEDLEESLVKEIFKSKKLKLETSTEMIIDENKSTITINIGSRLTSPDNIEMIFHKAKTVFYVSGLKETFNKKNNTFNLPDEFVIQLYGLSYTHARALLAIELSPTVYKGRFFLPIVNPNKFIKNTN